MYQNIATGQQLSDCDFFAYISSINWCNCGTDEVWISNNQAKNGQGWFMYFQSNPPSCADQAPTCMAPIINHAQHVGETLTVTNYSAIGIPTPTKSYQWQESIDNITFTDIVGAIGLNLAIISAYVGKYIRVKGTSTNGIGLPAVCYSQARLIEPALAAPSNVVAPVISGSTTQGSILTCTTGTWNGYPAPSLTYNWYADGIHVGTGNSYQLKLADSQKNITCVVTANNGINPNASATSNTIVAGDYSPQNTSVPVISGGTALGSQLTCSPGSWNGTNISFSYQWYSGLNPVGDDSAQYQLQITDTLANMSCVVTASNLAGTNSATSNTITAGDYSPINIVAPIIHVIGGGSANPGEILECTLGTWLGANINYSYQWYRGATPVGSNQNTYQVVVADTGASMTCVVTGTNLGGTTNATSNNINVPAGPGVSAPSNATLPSITVAGGGSALAGKTLALNVGTWNGTSPISYTFQWFSNLIPVAITPYYIMQPTDIGNNITCHVTATNAYGVDTAVSNSILCTGNIATPPSNIVPPTIAVYGGGSPIIGSTLFATIGEWNGTSPILYSYEWYSNLALVGNDSTYIVQPSDYGNTITCEVIATNAYGIDQATSNSLTAIGSAPVNVNPPSIVGGNTPGDILSINLGTWNASPAVSSYNYLWQFSTNGGATWNNYSPSQINPTKVVLTADIGRLIRCFITANNAAGTGIAFTNSLLIDSVPVNTAAPVISGPTLVGSILTTTDGTWTGSGTITFSYRWMRDGIAIVGAISNTYTTVTADAGRNITCEVTATNSIGPNRINGNVIIPTIAPSILAGPIIYGSYTVGSTLTVEKGDYSAYPAVGLSYQWQISTNGGTSWSNIVGQTGTSYNIQPGDVSNMIRVVETSSNGIGTPLVTNSNSATIITIVVQRPDNLVAPVISGNFAVGQTLSTTNGTWLNSPVTYDYQWLRNGSAIAGAITSTYTLVTSDANTLISCRVTANNAGGSEVAISNDEYVLDANFYAAIVFATAQGYVLPSMNQRYLLSLFVGQLKLYNWYSINDRMYFIANDGSKEFGRVNIMNPSLATMLTESATAPTWIANLGYTSNATNAFLGTQYTPSVNGVNYTLNSAGRYAYMTRRSNASTQSVIDGNVTANENTMRIAASATAHNINSGTNVPAAVPSSCNKYHAITRKTSTTCSRMTDVVQAINVNSTALPTTEQFILRSGSTYGQSGFYIGFYAIGGAIPDADLPAHELLVTKFLSQL